MAAGAIAAARRRFSGVGLAATMLAAVLFAACGGAQEELRDTPTAGADVASAPPTVRSAGASANAEATREATNAPPPPTLTSTATIPSAATATALPTATAEPPTPIPTPDFDLVWQVVGDCQFDPPTAAMQPGGSVTFVNATGSEIDVSIYLPNDAGIDGGGIEPGETSEAYEITLAGRVVVTCDSEGGEETTFGALIVLS